MIRGKHDRFSERQGPAWPSSPKEPRTNGFCSRATSRLFGQHGFSLGELLVVTATAVVVLGASLPAMSTTKLTFALRGETRRVYADLQKARMSAIMGNTRYVFDRGNDKEYSICRDLDTDDTCDKEDPDASYELSSGGVIFQGSSAVTFYADGSASAPVTITLQNRNGQTQSITVTQAGRVRIS